MFDSVREALDRAASEGVSLGEVALRAEAEAGLRSRGEIEATLARALTVMRDAVARGRRGDLRSVSGLVGGDAALVARSPGPLGGTLFTEVLSGALAVQEVNAAMGVIVAAPTAGGAGVLPGVLLGLAERHRLDDATLVRGLATAGLVGAVAVERAAVLVGQVADRQLVAGDPERVHGLDCSPGVLDQVRGRKGPRRSA